MFNKIPPVSNSFGKQICLSTIQQRIFRNVMFFRTTNYDSTDRSSCYTFVHLNHSPALKWYMLCLVFCFWFFLLLFLFPFLFYFLFTFFVFLFLFCFLFTVSCFQFVFMWYFGALEPSIRSQMEHVVLNSKASVHYKQPGAVRAKILRQYFPNTS